MSETNIENDARYKRIVERAEAGVGLLLAFVLVYIAAIVVVFLDMMMWRPW
jgi:hypothetical protein